MVLKLQCSFEIRVKNITNQLICRTESSNFEVFYCIGKRSHSIFRNFIYPQLRRFGFLEEFILSHRRDSNCPPKNFLSTTSFLLRFSSTQQFRCLYNRFYWIQTCPLDICFLNDFFSCGRFSKFSSRRACCFLSIIFSYMVQSCQLQLTLKFSIDSVGKRYS